MKALSLTQPWATLVALGEKRIETRSWGTNYRGPLAIHAAKGFAALPGGNLTDFCLNEPFASALHAGGVRFLVPGQDLPLGVVVATATLIDCIRLYTEKQRQAILDRWGAEHEQQFGDFNFNRYAWILRDVITLPEPIPARGSLGLWDWVAPPEVLARIEGRLWE